MSDLFALAHASGHLTVDAFARLAAQGTRRVFQPQERLMKQGEEATGLFVIMSGEVSVVREHRSLNEPIFLAALSAGEVIGEMGLLDGEPRSATVTATVETVAMEVPARAVAECVTKWPDLYGQLAKVLSKRLRDTNELVSRSGGHSNGDR